MSTLRLETYVPKAGVNKPKSRFGHFWNRLTRPASEPPYRPLPEYHIRVVTIKPGTTEYPLRVKLKTVDPRQAKYTALSYTWDLDDNVQSDAYHGPSGPTQVIAVGGSKVTITQNLFDALCQYRDTQSDVPVFVDALCIDFANNRERLAYTEIMGHIYARAASVIVWLGKKDKDSDEIMLIMRKLVNAIDWRKIDHADNYDFRDPYFFENIGMEAPSVRQWRKIHEFCLKRPFQRSWVFFELAASKQALFLWGEACMEYNFLIDFGTIVGMSGWLDDMRLQSFHSSSIGLTKMLGPVSKLRSIPPWHPKNRDHAVWMKDQYGLETEQQRAWKFFEILLESADAFGSQDPRDRVFAPLAYVRHVFGGKAVNKQWPRPDYRVSEVEVLRKFSTLIRQHTQEPSILESHYGLTVQQSNGSRDDPGRGRSDTQGRRRISNRRQSSSTR